ncbi:hypothetical protein SDJN02_13657, partial [Cucurbita argyrosperma subsp. argyrosperma]
MKVSLRPLLELVVISVYSTWRWRNHPSLYSVTVFHYGHQRSVNPVSAAAAAAGGMFPA